MLHCDLRVWWKVTSDLRLRDAISELETPSFCGISGDLAPPTRKSLAIAIVRLRCAKIRNEVIQMSAQRGRFWVAISLWTSAGSFGQAFGQALKLRKLARLSMPESAHVHELRGLTKLRWEKTAGFFRSLKKFAARVALKCESQDCEIYPVQNWSLEMP